MQVVDNGAPLEPWADICLQHNEVQNGFITGNLHVASCVLAS